MNSNEDDPWYIKKYDETTCHCGLGPEDHYHGGAADHSFVPREYVERISTEDAFMELQNAFGERDDPQSFQKPMVGCLCFFLGLLGTLAVATIVCKAAGVSLF